NVSDTQSSVWATEREGLAGAEQLAAVILLHTALDVGFNATRCALRRQLLGCVQSAQMLELALEFQIAGAFLRGALELVQFFFEIHAIPIDAMRAQRNFADM